MRTRRFIPWLIFALGAMAVLEGLGWVTWRAITLERREQRARAESAVQESLRLALWRMESELTPIVAQESSRPYFHYLSFYPALRSYEKMWDAIAPGEALAPSPLLEPPGAFVRLHYQIEADGTLTSPQVPGEAQRELATSRYVDPEFVMIARDRLDRLRAITRAGALQASAPDLGDAGGASLDGQSIAGARALNERDDPAPQSQIAPAQKLERAMEESRREFAARQQAADSANQATVPAQRKAAPADSDRQIAGVYRRDEVGGKDLKQAAADRASGAPAASAPAEEAPSLGGVPPALRRADTGGAAGAVFTGGAIEAIGVSISPLTARWVIRPRSEGASEPDLLLERRVTIGARSATQGVWIDWPALRSRLLGQVRNLLPQASLEPFVGRAAPEAQRLASIPALLNPAALEIPAEDGLSATKLILGVTWLAVLAAIGAIAFVLRQSLDLSERRGRFVSAVTHELRTPLTTFSLYTEMLERGLVREPEKQREYLSTLHGESRRLSGLVENVLAYARLGRARPSPAVEGASIDAAELVAQVEPALRRAAQSAGLELVVESALARGAEPGAAHVRADAQTVERILLNLVENAGKYASESRDPRVHLIARIEEGRASGILGLFASARKELHLTISDHGPGVPAGESRRIFAPFHRAAREERSAKPGLGLGLALARGLARELGGDLRLERAGGRGGEGAAFVLVLPIAE